MKQVLLIDDLRSFRAEVDDLVIARTSKDALAVLNSVDAEFSSIWLDHDLGGDDTINPVVHYLAERSVDGNAVKVDVIYVHTSNPVGAQQMTQSLTRYGYKVVRVSASDFFTA